MCGSNIPPLQPPKRGLVCPNCKVGKLKSVVDTYKLAGASQIRRRRVCRNCGQRATTYESVGFFRVSIRPLRIGKDGIKHGKNSG